MTITTLKIIQLILNMIGLFIIFVMEYKRCHPKRNLCENCKFLESKNTSNIRAYRCENKKNWLHDSFNKCPEICKYYSPIIPEEEDENDY